MAVLSVAEPVVAGPAEATPAERVRPPTRDLLEWIARAPRTYADVSETWRSTCPRFTVWEDALDAGLVRLERCAGMRFGEERVAVTELGYAALATTLRDAGDER